MSATVAKFEEHRSLEAELAETAHWLRVKQAALDGFRLQIAVGHEAAARFRADLGREDLAQEAEAKVEQLRADLELAEAWNPMTHTPRRIR